MSGQGQPSRTQVSEGQTARGWGGEYEQHKSGHTCLCVGECLKRTAEWDSGHWLLPHLSTAVDSHLGHIPETLMPGLSPDQAPFVEGLL